MTDPIACWDSCKGGKRELNVCRSVSLWHVSVNIHKVYICVWVKDRTEAESEEIMKKTKGRMRK